MPDRPYTAFIARWASTPKRWFKILSTRASLIALTIHRGDELHNNAIWHPTSFAPIHSVLVHYDLYVVESKRIPTMVCVYILW